MLLDGAAFERWLTDSPLEDRLVAYADKRAGQRLEAMADRFASWAGRYPVAEEAPEASTDVGSWTGASVRLVRSRADALEADVCDRLGVAPSSVRRLRWTGPALAAARAAR